MWSKISYWTRRLGLTESFDKVYFLFNRIRFRRKNKRFKHNNPFIKLPPEYSVYESYRLDYEHYFNDGRDTADWIIGELSAFTSLDNRKILDWGCGPARVTRHLPALLPAADVYGCDYNTRTIAWCKGNITGVKFVATGLQPPLPFDDSFFDITYVLSVFTHLSAQNHYEWMNELHRVMKPGGILLFTTQGDCFLSRLVARERRQFLRGSVVVRSFAKEGHRSYSTFQPQAFIRSVLGFRWEVLKCTPGVIRDWGPEQDTWIIKKPGS